MKNIRCALERRSSPTPITIVLNWRAGLGNDFVNIATAQLLISRDIREWTERSRSKLLEQCFIQFR